MALRRTLGTRRVTLRRIALSSRWWESRLRTSGRHVVVVARLGRVSHRRLQ